MKEKYKEKYEKEIEKDSFLDIIGSFGTKESNWSEMKNWKD